MEYQFRSALNGFHRGDVVAYLQNLMESHRTACLALQTELDRTKAELDTLQERCRKAEANGQSEPEPLQQQELEAYRRAEAAERTAQARIAALEHAAQERIAEQEKQSAGKIAADELASAERIAANERESAARIAAQQAALRALLEKTGAQLSDAELPTLMNGLRSEAEALAARLTVLQETLADAEKTLRTLDP